MVSDQQRPTGRFLLAVLLTLLFVGLASALPKGPSLDYISVSESPTQSSTQDTNTSHYGGRIITMNLNVTQQNQHWKAYVGNVTGRLVLEDAAEYSIFEWTITAVTGEVYATRGTTVNWTTVVCANLTQVNAEQLWMNHTSTYTPDDNITNTFSDTNNHTGFLAGASSITENACNYTTQTFVNDSGQNSPHRFEEILLYDGSSIVYTTVMESDEFGYHTGRNYDYQILVAERGQPGWTGQATSYYFYVELL